MAFHDHRPNRRLGRSERPLVKLTKDLTSFLHKAQRSLAHDTLHLSSRQRSILAHILVEFAEDLYQDIVARFHATELRDPRCRYVPRYRGRFLYLDREDYGRLHPICRLEYIGKMDGWSFAIYKYSDERYDDQEWFFPGIGHVDGTIEGAMRAGLEAYPT